MNPRTLGKHREPVEGCPQPDTPELPRSWTAAARDQACADTRRLDWLEREVMVDIAYSTDSQPVDAELEIENACGNTVRAKRLREALDKAMKRWPHN